eukprot:gene12246-10547_t
MAYDTLALIGLLAPSMTPFSIVQALTAARASGGRPGLLLARLSSLSSGRGRTSGTGSLPLDGETTEGHRSGSCRSDLDTRASFQ